MKKTAEKIEQAAEIGCPNRLPPRTVPNKIFSQEENQDVKALAETIPGESTKLFSGLAKKHEIVIIAPLFEKSQEWQILQYSRGNRFKRRNLGHLP